MTAGKTYVPLATQTLGSATASVTFSSISGAYTDLVLVVNGTLSSGGYIDSYVRFNSDSGTNYSRTYLFGDGGSTVSGRNSAATGLGFVYMNSTDRAAIVINIMNYANATTYKTATTRTTAPGSGGVTAAYVGLWRNTAAITTIEIVTGNTFAIGSTFTLYGIAAA